MLRNRGDMMFSGHIKSGANLVGLFIWIQMTRKIQNVISSKFQKSLKMGSVLYSVHCTAYKKYGNRSQGKLSSVFYGGKLPHTWLLLRLCSRQVYKKVCRPQGQK